MTRILHARSFGPDALSDDAISRAPLPPRVTPVILFLFPIRSKMRGMAWWGNKSEQAVIICYRCRKRISQDELSQGLHDHDREQPPEPSASAVDFAGM